MPNLKQPVLIFPMELKDIPSGVLYHYTNIEAFKAIIKSGFFLLSNFTDVTGDNEELRWASDKYIEIIRPLFPDWFNFPGMVPDRYFIFCVCRRSDNSYLWNTYATEKEGIAFSINVSVLYYQFNQKNHYIDMMPMEYDRAAFVKKCEKTIEGLLPIATNVIAPVKGKTYPKTELARRQFFNGIPSYSKFQESRLPAIEALMLQKAPKFEKEEEIRIFNWPDPFVHNLMPTDAFRGKEKAIMPWRFKDGHILTEVLRTEKCMLSEKEIIRYLEENGITCPVRTIIEFN